MVFRTKGKGKGKGKNLAGRLWKPVIKSFVKPLTLQGEPGKGKGKDKGKGKGKVKGKGKGKGKARFVKGKGKGKGKVQSQPIGITGAFKGQVFKGYVRNQSLREPYSLFIQCKAVKDIAGRDPKIPGDNNVANVKIGDRITFKIKEKENEAPSAVGVTVTGKVNDDLMTQLKEWSKHLKQSNKASKGKGKFGGKANGASKGKSKGKGNYALVAVPQQKSKGKGKAKGGRQDEAPQLGRSGKGMKGKGGKGGKAGKGGKGALSAISTYIVGGKGGKGGKGGNGKFGGKGGGKVLKTQFQKQPKQQVVWY